VLCVVFAENDFAYNTPVKLG